MSNQPCRDFTKISLKNTFNISQFVTMLCYDLAPNFKSQGETHDFWELVYVDRGEIIFTADSDKHRLCQGEIVFHKPGEFHRHECDGMHSATVFILSFDCRSSAMNYYRRKYAKVPSELTSLIKRLIDECTANFAVSVYPLVSLPNAPIGGQQLIRIYLEEFLIRMMRSEEKKLTSDVLLTSAGTTENKLAEEICKYLSNHVYERVTLEELSENFHFGKSHLCGVFKKAHGDTIVSYHLKLKISEAKRLLREEKMSVSEVSERLGFENPAYFSRIFGKIVGMSPRAFRKKLINSSVMFLEKEKKLQK